MLKALGDLVYSTNPETGESEYKEVLRTFRKESDVLIHIFVNGEEIQTTPVHPFWVEDQWVAAKDLEAGDILTLADGSTAPVTYTYGEKLDEPVIVYNFEVSDFHTYYVTDTGVLVHNDEGCIRGRKTGSYSEIVRESKGTEYDSHHIIQDAAVREVPGYNRSKAPAIQLAGPSTKAGSEHYTATLVQKRKGGGTYASERRIAYRGLREAGFTVDEAKSIVRKADEYFMGELNLTLDSVLRVPGGRRT